MLSVTALVVAYNVTAVGNRSEADDAFWFAYDVEHAPLRDLVGVDHTRHLLFLPLFRMLHALLGRIGLDFRAYDEMRFTSTIFAASAVVLMAMVLRHRFKLSQFAAIAGAIGLAASYGFWRYANEAEVYSLAILLVLALCWYGYAPERSIRSWVIVGALAGLAVLVDAEILSTALVAIGVVLLLKGRLRELTTYGLALVSSILAATLALYWYADPPGRHYLSYLLGGTGSETSGVAGSYNAGTLPKSLVGLSQDVTSGTFLLSYRAVAQRFQAQLPDKSSDLIYAARDAGTVAKVLPPILLLLLGTLSVLLILAIRSQRGESPDRRLVAGVALWSLALFIVLAGRDPIAPEAWTLILPALWIIVASLVFQRALRSGARRTVIALLAVLIALNFFGGIWVMRSRASDYNAQRARWLLVNAHSGDVVLTVGSKFFRYLRYYSSADVQCLEGLSADELQRLYESEAARAHHLYVTGDVLRLPSFLKSERPAEYEAITQFSRSVGANFKRTVDDEFGGIYLYNGPRSLDQTRTALLPASSHSC